MSSAGLGNMETRAIGICAAPWVQAVRGLGPRSLTCLPGRVDSDFRENASIFRNESWPVTSSTSAPGASAGPQGGALCPCSQAAGGATACPEGGGGGTGETRTLLGRPEPLSWPGLVCSRLRSCGSVVSQIPPLLCPGGSALAFLSPCLAQSRTQWSLLKARARVLSTLLPGATLLPACCVTGSRSRG